MRRWAGMALLEVILVIIMVAFLFLIAMDRLLPLRGQAEAASVTVSIGVMQAALGNRIAATVLKEGFAALPQYVGSNPVDLLAKPPKGYLGAQPEVDLDALPPGSWVFDESRGTLIYRVRYGEYFEGSLRDPPRGEWRIEARYADDSTRPEDLRSVLLVPLAEVRWRRDEPAQ